MKQEEGLGRNTFTSILVMGATLVSRVLGFVRLIAVTTMFGPASADVINLAFSIPNNLRKLLAEGALSSAFIPVLSANLVKGEDGTDPRGLVTRILSFQVFILVPVCILSVLFSDTIIRILSDFSDQAQISAASKLFKYVINYLLLISISAVFMGVLNAHRKFIVPGITPILFSISVISSIALFRKSLDVYAMAVGVLAGGIAQIVFQYPVFHRLGYRFRLTFRLKDPEFRKIMVQWLPILATSSVFTLAQQIAFKFASGMYSGSVTAVSIALTFFQLPFGIFSASITNVLFPRMSSQVARKDIDGFKESMSYGISFLISALVPSLVFLCLMSTQLISVGFLKGAFGPASVELASPVLVFYSLGLVSVGIFTFMQRAFYSLHDYKVPFFTALIVATVDILLSLWLKETVLRTGGIPLANSISFSIGALILIFVMRQKRGSMKAKSMVGTTAKVVVSTLPGAAALLAFNRVLPEWWASGRTLGGFVLIFAAALIFSVVVLFGYRITKMELLSDLIDRFRRKSHG